MQLLNIFNHSKSTTKTLASTIDYQEEFLLGLVLDYRG